MANRCVSRRDRFLGALLGGAVGEALGAPFEGDWGHSIPAPDELLAGYRPLALVDDYPLGQYTDDTQMSLATVRAFLEVGEARPAAIADALAALWLDGTIISPASGCTRALARYLRSGDWQTCGAPPGYAGNGPAARLAVAGLFFLDRPNRLPPAIAPLARITHADVRSVAGAVATAQAAQLLALEPGIGPEAFCERLAATCEPLEPAFADMLRQLPELLDRPTESALRVIASAGMFDRQFDEPIITPFVIPTVLAALWCMLRHADDWSAAVAAAISLGGEVDTLGGIVGGLMGIRLGFEAVPEHLRDGLVDADEIAALAGRLHDRACRAD